MALLMLGATGIHFATMGEHAGVSWSHGLFFGLTAWAQLMLAGLLVLGPTRRVDPTRDRRELRGDRGVDRVTHGRDRIGTDGTPEPVEFADTLCTVFEGLTIALGLVVICGGFARRRVRLGTGWAIGAFVAVVVAALTSFGFTPAIADSSGGGHGHADGETAAAPSSGAAGTGAEPTHTHNADQLAELQPRPAARRGDARASSPRNWCRP